MVKDSHKVYTFIKNSIYYFSINEILTNFHLNWNQLLTQMTPQLGLFNYGIEITKRGKIVIYGGNTEQTPVCSFRSRTLINYNQLWILDTTVESPNFGLVNWIPTVGGFSRIVSLGGELICIMNANFDNGMKMIDIGNLISYDVVVSGIPANLIRNGFGVAGRNNTDFIIYGGYNQIDSISELSPFNILYQLSFSNTDLTEKFVEGAPISLSSEGTVGMIFAIVGILLVGVLVVFYQRKIKDDKIKVREDRLEKMKEINVALENSKKSFEERAKSIVDDPEFTATLALPNDGTLSVPGYREKLFGVDFRLEDRIAKGGMGEVFLGKLLNTDIIKNFNNGSEECIIKK
jgi:hypothetical protein